MIILPLNTQVVYVGEDGERNARVIEQPVPGAARIAFDDEGNHTALAVYSDQGEKGTFHLPSAGAAAAKPAPFRPGTKKTPEAAPEAAPAKA